MHKSILYEIYSFMKKIFPYRRSLLGRNTSVIALCLPRYNSRQYIFLIEASEVSINDCKFEMILLKTDDLHSKITPRIRFIDKNVKITTNLLSFLACLEASTDYLTFVLLYNDFLFHSTYKELKFHRTSSNMSKQYIIKNASPSHCSNILRYKGGVSKMEYNCFLN